ncbi:hypothetical protein JCM3774_001251 [Rhodotorula dairenensis]
MRLCFNPASGRTSPFVVVLAAALLSFGRCIHAQGVQSSLPSVTGAGPTTSASLTTRPPGMSTVVLGAPSTRPFPNTTSTATITTGSSSSPELPAPTANTTTSTSQQVRLWGPKEGLVTCRQVDFAFAAPAVPKSCGVYVTNTSTYLQQIPLGGDFTPLTSGTFSWLVDLPAGLSVEIQFWVTINNRVEQYTLHNLVVQPGENTSCIATGPGHNTQSIVSYASSLNSSPTAAATAKSDRGPPVAPIVGGVVGGLGGLALLFLLTCFCLRRRRHTRSQQLPPPLGDNNGPEGDKAGITHAQMVARSYQDYNPTDVATTANQSGVGSGSPTATRSGGQVAPVPYVTQTEMRPSRSVTTLRTADFVDAGRSGPDSSSSPISPSSGSLVAHPAVPVPYVSQRERGNEGTQGLDDPATFSTRHR